MSIGNAIKFIRTIDSDASFRAALYRVDGYDDLQRFLGQRELNHSMPEFEEAFNHLHTLCQEAWEADKLYNVLHLLRLIIAQS